MDSIKSGFLKFDIFDFNGIKINQFNKKLHLMVKPKEFGKHVGFIEKIHSSFFLIEFGRLEIFVIINAHTTLNYLTRLPEIDYTVTPYF
jgi:hypothetical protein